jgi:hypothetical protein
MRFPKLFSVAPLLIAVILPVEAFALGEFPSNPDPKTKYIFYMHGVVPETRGHDGDYNYWGIVKALQEKGLVVIGEARGPTKLFPYASAISDQVNRLLDAGVPPANITVAGHSKGGVLSLIISIGLGRDDIKFAVLAACGSKRPYRVFVMRRAKGLQGKFLIMWDKNDHAFGACDESLRKGRNTFTNKILDDGGGHELFNKPAPVWIDPLVSFAKGG